MKNILFFLDSDKDDLYSLNLLISQHFLYKINIIGIICDDGFLSFPENVSIVNHWLDTIYINHNIPVYNGLPRDKYLKMERYFPKSFITSYLYFMKKHFNYNENKKPKYYDLSQFMIDIKKYENYDILTTGNLTTLSFLIDNCCDFYYKINSIYSMIGNYNVDGNVFPNNNIKIQPNSEYNAYLDPLAFNNVIQTYNINIIPLNCTNYAPLTKKNIELIEKIGILCCENCKDKFLIKNYNFFIDLLKITILTENNTLYMWDLVATCIFLDYDMKQTFLNKKIDIAWTGEIIKGNYKSKIYNYIDFKSFIIALFYSLFNINIQSNMLYQHLLDEL